MPSTSRTTASVADHGPVVERSADLDGYHASFVTFAIDVDGDAGGGPGGAGHEVISAVGIGECRRRRR